MRFLLIRTAALTGIGFLSGCGTYVPQMAEPWEHAKASAFESDIQAHVFCEFARAVREAKHPEKDADLGWGDDQGDELDPDDRDDHEVPRNWQASIGLVLEVDEASSLNPGVSIVSPMSNMQNFATTFGVQLQAQTLHFDTFDFRYDLNEILDMKTEQFKSSCQPKPNSSLLSSGHPLRIRNWLHSGLEMVRRDPLFNKPASGDGKDGHRPNLLQYETKFIVTTSGSVTPAWKLTRVLTNQSAVVPPTLPFLSGNRIRTHDLIITMGPAAAGQNGKRRGLRSNGGTSEPGSGSDVTAFHLNAVSAAQIADQLSSQLNGLRVGY